METVGFAAGAATVLSAWQLVPQMAKSMRTQSTTGLSPTWAAIGGMVNIGWFGYRWSQELWLSLFSPAIAATLYFGLLWLVLRFAPQRRSVHAAVFGVALSLAAAGASGGWPLVGTVLGLWAAVQITPAVWSAHRARGPLAIAPGLWIVGLSQALLWGYYGTAVGDSALVLYGITVGTGALTILLRYALRHGRASGSPTASPGAATPNPPTATATTLLVGRWATPLVIRR